MKVGEYIGGLYKRVLPDGKEEWVLHESKITKIVQNSKGTKVYSKGFYPLDVDEIESNTKIMEDADNYILVREVVLLNEIVRPKYERWLKWANENPDKVKSILQ